MSAGGLAQGLAATFNLGPIRNALALWLGIEPADLFLYIFLPPMLLDAAVRIDYFLLRKVRAVLIGFGHPLDMHSRLLLLKEWEAQDSSAASECGCAKGFAESLSNNLDIIAANLTGAPICSLQESD